MMVDARALKALDDLLYYRTFPPTTPVSGLRPFLRHPEVSFTYRQEAPPMLLALQRIDTELYMDESGYFGDEAPRFSGSLRKLLNVYALRHLKYTYTDPLRLVEVEPVQPKPRYQAVRTVAS
jgi:hypothetical protein